MTLRGESWGWSAGPRPRPLDIAAGMLIGTDPEAYGLPAIAADLDPRVAVESVVASALARPPALVSFSGGRDSSAVLAVAAAVARREGLPLPVPATFRYPEAPATDETEWQELVVRHLGLSEWIRVEIRDELEALGPVATAVLERHGLLFPPNAYAHVPLFQHAGGGALMTGVGGDELFGFQGTRVARVLARTSRPVPRDALRLLMAAAPRSLRARNAARRIARDRPWLRPHAERRLVRELASWEASWPQRWDRGLDAWVRSRAFQASHHALDRLASDAGVAVLSPFIHPEVLAAFGCAGGAVGFRGRTAAMERFFGDLLPAEVLRRSSKAAFDQTLWRARTRAFVASWDGSGVDPELVDAEALRATWASDAPDGRTLSLLLSAWLRSARGSAVRPSAARPVAGDG